MLNTAVFYYFSPTGGTKRVADALQESPNPDRAAAFIHYLMS